MGCQDYQSKQNSEDGGSLELVTRKVSRCCWCHGGRKNANRKYQHLLMGVWALPGQANDVKEALAGRQPSF